MQVNHKAIDFMKKIFDVIKGKKTLKIFHEFPLTKIFGNFYWDKLKDKNSIPEKTKIINNNELYIEPNDWDVSRRCYLFSYYEHETSSILNKLINKNDIAVDVGAHIGYYTMLLSGLVGKKGRVYSFEPDPTSFKLLKKNVKHNHYDERVTCEKRVVSNSNKIVSLSLNPRGGEENTLKEMEKWEKIDVKSLKLDDYFDEKIDFIKIDVEGAEPLVIEGMQNLLEKYRPTIVMEYLPDQWECDIENKFENKPKLVFSYLKKLEYDFYLPSNGRLKKIKINKIIENELPNKVRNIVIK